jgi:hypothetical protein
VLDGLLLKPLPYKDANRVVILHAHTELYGDQWMPYLNYLDLKREFAWRLERAPVMGQSLGVICLGVGVGSVAALTVGRLMMRLVQGGCSR